MAEQAGGTEALHEAGAGRLRVSLGERQVDVRVGYLPTVAGTKLTLRILDPQRVVTDWATVVPEPEDRERLEALLGTSHGVILISGPGGSGKTTLAYAMLQRLVARGLAVFSVEDPVEVRLDGLVQVQSDARLPPAAALRRVVHNDADVVFVAQGDDGEAARLACRIALAGHLVLVQNDAGDTAEALGRFTRAVGDDELVRAAVVGATSQRLVRRVCPTCRGASCGACHDGFRGRFALYEVRDRSGDEEVLRTLQARGEAAVARGDTTAAEVARVLPARRPARGSPA